MFNSQYFCMFVTNKTAIPFTNQGIQTKPKCIAGLYLHRLQNLPSNFRGHYTFVIGDGNLVDFSRALVSSRHVQDAVSVNVEGDLDLRDTSRRGRDTGQLKLAQQVLNTECRKKLVVRNNWETINACRRCRSGKEHSRVPLQSFHNHISIYISTVHTIIRMTTRPS